MNERVRQKTFIREWREHRGLSLRQLEAKLVQGPDADPAITFASLSRLERGLQPYTQDALEAIASALEASPADLLAVNPNHDSDYFHMYNVLDFNGKQEVRSYMQFLLQRKSA